MNSKASSLQNRLHEIIFESDTPEGKAFDVALLVAIVGSIVVVLLDSLPALHARHQQLFMRLEWAFTILFTIEYLLRLYSVYKPMRYALSFFGIIDLLAILPSFLSLFVAGAQTLLVLRTLRLLRVFRIFGLQQYLTEMRFLGGALKASLNKILIFLFIVLTVVIILGAVMFLVEDGANGFTSIPESIYWAIVTITTVGYGDISPVTPLGKFVASIIMLLGYGILAVPTGIITSEMTTAARHKKDNNQVCPGCGKEGHEADAAYCKYCGTKM